MKPQDILGLAIRFSGLLGIFLCVRHLVAIWHRRGSPHLDEPVKLIFELGLICVGVYMVAGCPLFFKIIFRDKDSDSRPGQSKDKTPE